MTEYQMMLLCAEAMGWRTHAVSSKIFYCPDEQDSVPKSVWNPLKDDFQAMALVKKLGLNFTAPTTDDKQWYVWTYRKGEIVEDADLNLAIVKCVAHMQSTRTQ